jgi:PadR family transcriptional regulator, regulatory protein PadR
MAGAVSLRDQRPYGSCLKASAIQQRLFDTLDRRPAAAIGSASNFDVDNKYRDSMTDRSLYTGLIRLHVLHHAAEEPIYGQAMIDELSRHGYRLSAGTLYPILHGMERQGYLRSKVTLSGGRNRRMYRATRAGRAALVEARQRVQELFGEMFEHG